MAIFNKFLISEIPASSLIIRNIADGFVPLIANLMQINPNDIDIGDMYVCEDNIYLVFYTATNLKQLLEQFNSNYIEIHELGVKITGYIALITNKVSNLQYILPLDSDKYPYPEYFPIGRHLAIHAGIASQGDMMIISNSLSAKEFNKLELTNVRSINTFGNGIYCTVDNKPYYIDENLKFNLLPKEIDSFYSHTKGIDIIEGNKGRDLYINGNLEIKNLPMTISGREILGLSKNKGEQYSILSLNQGSLYFREFKNDGTPLQSKPLFLNKLFTSGVHISENKYFLLVNKEPKVYYVDYDIPIGSIIDLGKLGIYHPDSKGNIQYDGINKILYVIYQTENNIQSICAIYF